MKLILHHLCVRYPNGPHLGPWTHTLETGLYHLRGPNGSGKSTLLAAVSTALRRTSGSVWLDGVDPEVNVACRARIGFLSAQPSLPGFLTVREAWRMGASLRRRPDWDGVPLEVALALPPEVRLSQCSTGMRQKAELLVALAGDPDLLVLDEPFANLDEESVGWILRRLDAHAGIALVAHHGNLRGATAIDLGGAPTSLRGSEEGVKGRLGRRREVDQAEGTDHELSPAGG